jgi:GcrA cell cycle regulator
MSWTEERIATLESLWRSGASAREIATSLGGVTRNAVIGKAHRLGLAGVGPGEAPRTRQYVRPPRKPSAAPKRDRPARDAAPRRPVAEPDAATVVRLTNLGPHMCRWPIGDPAGHDFGFCGRSATGVYCAGHTRVAYTGRSEASRIVGVAQRKLAAEVVDYSAA